MWTDRITPAAAFALLALAGVGLGAGTTDGVTAGHEYNLQITDSDGNLHPCALKVVGVSGVKSLAIIAVDSIPSVPDALQFEPDVSSAQDFKLIWSGIPSTYNPGFSTTAVKAYVSSWIGQQNLHPIILEPLASGHEAIQDESTQILFHWSTTSNGYSWIDQPAGKTWVLCQGTDVGLGWLSIADFVVNDQNPAPTGCAQASLRVWQVTS